jgi:hypothetical protein
MRLGFSRLALALSFGLVLFATAPALAIPVTLDVFADGVHIGTANQDNLGCTNNPDGVSANCFVQNLPYGTEYPLLNIDEISLHIDSDPVVTGTTVITNTFSTTQHITLLFTLPVTAIPGATLTGGSFRGTVTDRDGDGATLATFGPGSSLYTAMIDGADWQTLYQHNQSFSAGQFLSSNVSSTNFGSPIPSLLGPPALNTIGIRLDFTLTAFDSASFTSNHVVIPVPEPHTAGLLLIGLALLGKRRRS